MRVRAVPYPSAVVAVVRGQGGVLSLSSGSGNSGGDVSVAAGSGTEQTGGAIRLEGGDGLGKADGGDVLLYAAAVVLFLSALELRSPVLLVIFC
ncbi:hypothetical protein B484DRAFT_411279 [Ochromonadaceae sp. CCMP2298]|nr:hypothetical protein B484DRAFT_411279 [Ochromonadaceae sp. CCMP2298]